MDLGVILALLGAKIGSRAPDMQPQTQPDSHHALSWRQGNRPGAANRPWGPNSFRFDQIFTTLLTPMHDPILDNIFRHASNFQPQVLATRKSPRSSTPAMMLKHRLLHEDYIFNSCHLEKHCMSQKDLIFNYCC